jgi:hypothetical protein
VCSPANDQATLEAIAAMPEVLYIERKYPVHTSNRWAKGVCQTGSWDKAPLYLSGNLTGKNQIIGVSDTGMHSR